VAEALLFLNIGRDVPLIGADDIVEHWNSGECWVGRDRLVAPGNSRLSPGSIRNCEDGLLHIEAAGVL